MKIKDFLNKRVKWTKYAPARNKKGVSILFNNPEASCWCLSGAVYYCYPEPERETIFEKLFQAIKTLMGGVFCCYPLSKRSPVVKRLSQIIKKIYKISTSIKGIYANEDRIILFNDNKRKTTFKDIKSFKTS